MESSLKILLLENSLADAELIERFLAKEIPGCTVKHVNNRNSFLESLGQFGPDVILSDHSLPQFDSQEALQLVRNNLPHAPFILVTGTVSEEYAVDMIKQGADDYILKDRIRRLPTAIATSLQRKKSENSIRHSEAIRKLIMNSALDAIVCINTSGKIIVWTPRAEKIFGWSETEVLHKQMVELIIPLQYREKHMAGFKNYLERGESSIQNKLIELTALRQTGEEFPIELLVIPIKEVGNDFFCAFIRDISERKKAEKKLIDNEKRYRTIFQKNPFSMWVYDPHSLKFLEVNEAAIRYYGYSRDEFLKMTLKDIRPIEDIPLLLEDISQIDVETDSRTGIWQHKIKSGELITVELTAHSIEFDGKIARMVIANDITDKLRKEEVIRKTNERFEYVTLATSDIVWEQNFETGKYQLHEGKHQLSGGFRRIMDWQEGWDQLSFYKPDKMRVIRSFLAARNDPSRLFWQDDYRLLSGNQHLVYITNHAIFIRDANGKALRAIGAISNITDKKKLEIRLQEQQMEEQVKITATALEAQERERNELGKELHDNVNQILVGTKLLLATVKNIPERDKQLVRSCIDNLQQAINENRRMAHALVTPDLEADTLVELITRLTGGMLDILGVKVMIDTSGYDDSVLSEAKKIAVYRIVQEQCTNIVKYAGASRVNILLQTSGRAFKMVIADDGIGMESGKATAGIGLRNINSRLSIFNGQVNIVTAPGKGFRMEIDLPY